MSDTPHPFMEPLEDRALLSASIIANPAPVLTPAAPATVVPATPSTPQHAREFEALAFEHGRGVVVMIVSVDPTANTITVSRTRRHQTTQATFNVSPTATITVDGTATTLAQLPTNVPVTLTTDPTNATTVTAVAAVGQDVKGSVTAVDTTNNTLTVAGQGGAPAATYNVGPTVTITVNGQTGALAGIPVGSMVDIRLSALDATAAVSITDVHGDVKGSVVSADATAGTITISTTRHGVTSQTTYHLSATAAISIDGAAATLDQFTAGVEVTLKSDPTDASLISSITAVGKEVEGRVMAVDTTNGTVTLAARHGQTATYTVGSGAIITVNGATGTLAGVSVGTFARLKLSALDGTKVISLDVYNARTGGDQGEQRQVARSQFASVVSVDTTANTITVTSPFGGQSTQTTYNVAPTAPITIDGAAGTLGQLAANVPVVLRLDTTTSPATVTSITAIGRDVEGRVSAVDTTAGTISLTGRDGAADTTYTIGSAPITVNGAPGTLAQITAGATAELKLSALNSANVVSVHATTANDDGWGWFFGHHRGW